MAQTPEGSPQPAPETLRTRQEVIKELGGKVAGAVKRFVQVSALPSSQRGQLGIISLREVLEGTEGLHRLGVITENEGIRNGLRNIFNDPRHQEFAIGLVAEVEERATSHDPNKVQSLPAMLDLSGLLGINDPAKFPDLAPRLDVVRKKTEKAAKAKARRAEREQIVPHQADAAVTVRTRNRDFIPLASEVRLEDLSEPDVNQNALIVAFGDVMGYLPNTAENITMLTEANDGKKPALLRLAGLAVDRGYLNRSMQNLTRLIAQSPDRAGEVIPILEALSACDPKSAKVFQLLGDVHLQLGEHILDDVHLQQGEHKEAIEAYKEYLKRPPKE